tara:strand:- start:17198 stop:17305 length:108 start_codon:yes stop_codon:yes gene_type:complete
MVNKQQVFECLLFVNKDSLVCIKNDNAPISDKSMV